MLQQGRVFKLTTRESTNSLPRRSAGTPRFPRIRASVDAIDARDLRKVYRGQIRALDGLTFSVRHGEILGLLGPNGAGKSTAVKILATLTRPDTGTALVGGHDVVRDPVAARRVFGYVSQRSTYDAEATGRENLLLQGRLQKIRGRALEGRVSNLLEVLGLADVADRPARTYSGGMARRLDIALGLVHRPSVLFLDEPTTGLDPEARSAMWSELERLVRLESLTVLLTTHYLDEADALSDRVVIVARGRTVVEGGPEELKRDLKGDCVVIRLGGRISGRRGAFERAVHALPGVQSARLSRLDHVLRVRVANGETALPEIISQVEREAVPVDSVTVVRPSLDDVYLHFTGRDFSTDDAQDAN